MKSKSIGRLILLALLAPGCGGGKGISVPNLPARWSSQYRTPTTVNLRAVKFDSTGLHGVVAGEAGTFVRTDDGGITWWQVESAPANRGADILAIGTANTMAVAVGADSATGGSAAFTSSDAINWYNTEEAAYPPPRFTEPWVDVAVVVPANPPWSYRLRPSGKVDLYDGTIPPVTKDSTISQVPTPNATWSNAATGIVFFDISGYGLVCGGDGGFGQIRGTVTNGDTWDTRSIVNASNTPITCPIFRRFSMLTNYRGYVCGDGGTVFGTPDTLYWRPVPSQVGWAGAANLRGISFMFDGATGWVVGLGGAIYKLSYSTTTTLWTWTDQSGVTNQDLYDVNFVDINIGYAVGNNGTVVKTINGGALWSLVSGPTPAPWPRFNAVDFSPDGVTGLAVGNGGVVLRTLDGGATWINFNLGIAATVNLTGVSIPRSGSGNMAYLCGSDTGVGKVFIHTGLKGSPPTSWQPPTTLPAGAGYEAILFPNADLNGVCVGGTALLFTTDSGANWTSRTPGGTFHALGASADGNTLYAAGDASVIRQSIDDPSTVGILDIGSVWSAIATPLTGAVTTNLSAIQAPSGTTFTLFVAGADNNVWRLSAGASPAWTSTTPFAATAPMSLAFPTDLLGWAVTQGTNGGVFYTVNGGSSWIRSFLHVKISPANNLRAIWMNAAQTGTAVGDGGMILKTTTGGQ